MLLHQRSERGRSDLIGVQRVLLALVAGPLVERLTYCLDILLPRNLPKLMIAAGVNAKALSTYMGHAGVAITYDRYGHLMPGNEAEAAELLDSYLNRSGCDEQGWPLIQSPLFVTRKMPGVDWFASAASMMLSK